MYLIQPLTELMCQTIDENKLYDFAEAIIPVPLHPARHRERGFNQSELMSTVIGKNFSIPVITTLLIRKKNTHPQFDLTKDQRIKNIHDAFSIHKQYAHHVPERVLLIDDICTTGETFHECTTALKKAGVKEITCLALARD